MYANLVIVAVLLLPCTLVVLYLEKLVNISPALVTDVKLLFAAMFINFMVTIIATTFSTATFAANRLDLSALRTIESQILKAALLIVTFTLLPVHVSYIGYATLLANVYLFLTYIHYTKKLLPQNRRKPLPLCMNDLPPPHPRQNHVSLWGAARHRRPDQRYRLEVLASRRKDLWYHP